MKTLALALLCLTAAPAAEPSQRLGRAEMPTKPTLPTTPLKGLNIPISCEAPNVAVKVLIYLDDDLVTPALWALTDKKGKAFLRIKLPEGLTVKDYDRIKIVYTIHPPKRPPEA